MAQSVDYSTEELYSLAQKAVYYWGLDETSQVHLVKHRENAVFKIVSQQGAYAMRIHRQGYHSDQELHSELLWIRDIPDSELFTAHVLPALSGELFIKLSLDSVRPELQIDLLEWADGTPIASIEEGFSDLSDIQATYHQVGRLMAISHLHSIQWEVPKDFSRHSWDEHGCLGPDSLWGDYKDLAQLTEQQVSLIDKAVAQARKDLQAFGQSADRYGLIHADFLPENLLRSDKGICLIDFDDAGYGWHLFDIATALFPYLGEDAFDLALNSLIEGYSELRELEHIDKLPLFLFIRSVTYLGWMHTRKESTTAQQMTDMVVQAAEALAEQYLAQFEESDKGSVLGSATTDLSQLALDDQALSALVEERQSSVGGSLLFYKQPMIAQRGEGCYLYDHHGNAYVDCYNNVQSVGHANPVVADAIHKQLTQVNTHTRYLNPMLTQYAQQLTSTMPDGLDVVFFTNSGSEANDLAMRIASEVSGHNGALVMDSAYHGNSYLANCLSPIAFALQNKPLPKFISTLPLPTSKERTSADVTQALNQLESKGTPVAAFMCDSIFDSYGGHIAPHDFFTTVYQQVREKGGFCIADEVQSGFGRTGKMWGFEQYGVVPDMVTLGKPMGNGHPIGAVVTSHEIAQRFMQSTIYFNTFGGNAASCAAASAVLDQIEHKQLVQHANQMEPLLRDQLEKLQSQFACITNVRGRGLYFSFDIQGKNGELDYSLAKQIPDAMKEQGVLIGLTGVQGCSVKIRPPLVFGEVELQQLVTAFKRVFEQLSYLSQVA